MKILLCGYFAFKTNDNGGQCGKSRELYRALSSYYGSTNVEYIDTLDWKKHPVCLLLDFLAKASKSECIIMLPAYNGVEVFARLLKLCKNIKHKHIFYCVIGGWLAEKTKKKSNIRIIKWHEI